MVDAHIGPYEYRIPDVLGFGPYLLMVDGKCVTRGDTLREILRYAVDHGIAEVQIEAERGFPAEVLYSVDEMNRLVALEAERLAKL